MLADHWPSKAFRKDSQLVNQRALPDAKQQRLELIETFGSEFGAPFALDDAKNIVDLRICGTSAFR